MASAWMLGKVYDGDNDTAASYAIAAIQEKKCVWWSQSARVLESFPQPIES